MDLFSATEDASKNGVRYSLMGPTPDNPLLSNPVYQRGYHAEKNNSFHQISPRIPQSDTTGWKFHISVDPADTRKAWNLVADEAMKHGLTAKVISEKHNPQMADPTYDQRGKNIVIYDRDGVDMPGVLKNIEQKLQTAGVRPGPSAVGDRQLGHSSFMNYRHDGNGAGGKYIPADRVQHLQPEQRYNPTGAADPFENIDLGSVKPGHGATVDRTSKEYHLDQAAQRTRAQLADPTHKPVPKPTPVDIDLNQLEAEARKNGGPTGQKPSAPAAPKMVDDHLAVSSARAQAQLAEIKPGGVHPHAPKVKGIFATAVAAGAAVVGANNAAAAEHRPVQTKDVVKAAVETVYPREAIAKGRYAEASMQVLENVDPTAGMASGAVRSVVRAAGGDVEPGAVEGAKKANSAGVLAATNWNEKIRREQLFLMNPEHPGQLGTLKMKDAQGQDVDVAKALKDKNHRAEVVGEIDRRLEKATTAKEKSSLGYMRDAAEQYGQLEDKRREVPAVKVAERELPAAGPAKTMAANHRDGVKI